MLRLNNDQVSFPAAEKGVTYRQSDRFRSSFDSGNTPDFAASKAGPER
jgi:hypothetical protein